MRITAEMAIHGVARALHEQIAPALQDGFAREAARLAELLLTLSANGLDDAAEVRMTEIAHLRALFAEASPVLGQDPLAATLAEAARGEAPGLRISALDNEIGRLRRLLIALHRAVEARDDPAARELDRSIWLLLRDTDALRAPRD